MIARQGFCQVIYGWGWGGQTLFLSGILDLLLVSPREQAIQEDG